MKNIKVHTHPTVQKGRKKHQHGYAKPATVRPGNEVGKPIEIKYFSPDRVSNPVRTVFKYRPRFLSGAVTFLNHSIFMK